MIQTTLSFTVVSILEEDLRSLHERMKAKMNLIGIPSLPPGTDFNLSEDSSAALFEMFAIECDHFGSSLAFYQAYIKLNYFMVMVQNYYQKRIEFTSLTLPAEDVLIINNFAIFKDIK